MTAGWGGWGYGLALVWMWHFRRATRRDWKRPRVHSFARLRLVLRGLGFIFRGWMWTSICRGFCRDFLGRELGWRRGWVRSEENRAARRNYRRLVGMGSWAGDLR